MYTEWTLFDSETERLRLAEAYDQKDAIRKAISRDIIPRKSDDVRPRLPRATSNNSIMSPEEFSKFMEGLQM